MTSDFQVIPTPSDAILSILKDLNDSFLGGKTLPIEWRKTQLRSLWKLIDENEAAIRGAISEDLGKPMVLIQVLEILCVKNDIVHCLNNLDSWLAVESVSVPPPFEKWSPVIQRRPKGTCVAIGTWNYPITLTLIPLIGIIACGNTGILKPSELAPHTAMLLSELFPKYLDHTCFRVVNGGKETAQRLLEESLGHILFTGGSKIGKEVMTAAAKSLTPLTLELGGRNSVVVTENADIKLAATRIAWAKFANAGQTCFAPNQVLVQSSVYDTFVSELIKTYAEFYQHKPDVSTVGRIVNKTHWRRVMTLLASTKGKTIVGGAGNEETLFIEPTIVKNVPADDQLIQTEIFGPILPVVQYSSATAGKQLLQSLSTGALAVYIFSTDMQEANEIVAWTSAGTAAINDVMAQIAPSSLPFGGVGQSGFGTYRGKASIDTFSNLQSIVTVPTVPQFEAMLGWRYPQAESMDTVEFVKANLEANL